MQLESLYRGIEQLSEDSEKYMVAVRLEKKGSTRSMYNLSVSFLLLFLTSEPKLKGSPNLRIVHQHEQTNKKRASIEVQSVWFE